MTIPARQTATLGRTYHEALRPDIRDQIMTSKICQKQDVPAMS